MKKSIFCILAIAMVLTGCNNDNSLQETTSPTSTTETISEDEIVYSPAPIIDKTQYEDIVIEKYLWEKPYQAIKTSDVCLGADWEHSIIVGGVDVTSTKFTEIASLPNYFFKENDSFGDLQELYHSYAKRAFFQADRVDYQDFLSADFTLYLSSLNNNVMIDSLRFNIICNPYEGGLDDLIKMNSFDNGKVGLGSSYDACINILGEPEEKDVRVNDEFETVLCKYDSDNVSMNLVFTQKKDDPSSGVLTWIEWTPKNLSLILNTTD